VLRDRLTSLLRPADGPKSLLPKELYSASALNLSYWVIANGAHAACSVCISRQILLAGALTERGRDQPNTRRKEQSSGQA
jgi:hypothetical protein